MTSPPCRLLLIEDNHRQAAMIENACCPNSDQATIDVVTNGAEAEAALDDGEYDLIICDLALPPDERRFEPDTAEGIRLFELIRERSQGTPVIILSGNADLQMMQGFFKSNRAADLYGTRTEEPLVQFFEKEQLPDCVDAVRTHVARTLQLDQLELTLPAGVTLSLSDERALRIFGRRTGAVEARIDSLDGGLSGSKTFKVAFQDGASANTGTVVAKLGALSSVLREYAKYDELAAKLPVGLGAHIIFMVGAGAGKRGALIYQLADEYTESLFGLLGRRDPQALKAVRRLRARLTEWVVDAPVVARTLTDIRRGAVGDYKLREAGWDYARERGVEVNVRESMVHGDLHGLNILINPQGEPTLIDYGEVRRANAALDPVTLELSAVFHPAVAGTLGGWPSEEQASEWFDLDAYCLGCPIEEFVRECRDWASSVAAGDGEVLASGYAFAVRQLKYKESTLAVASAIAEGTLATLTT
jgi:CheY-like chemotaxis protein